MLRKKLTPQSIRNLTPSSEGEYSVHDSVESALSVRVRPGGARSYQVRYRVKGEGRQGTVRRFIIGSVDDVSLSEARSEASRIRANSKLGNDPAGDRTAKRREMTMADLCDSYLGEGVATKKSSTLATDRGRIERHIKPLLGRKRIGDVTQADVERFMRDVANGKTAADIKTGPMGRAIVQGGKGTATRTVGLLGGIFSFAVRRKLRSDNPVRGVKRFPDQKCDRFLSPEEFGNLGEALRAFEANGGNSAAIATIRLWTFTGARKSEITKLRWAEVDLGRRCLRLGDSKSGAKVIVLGPAAIVVIEAIEKTENSPYVFPATDGNGHYQGAEKVWKKVRKAAGLDDVRIHDLRHSFASIGLTTGDTLPVIGKLLGHANVQTTARYAHLADDPVRAAAARISSTIADAMNR